VFTLCDSFLVYHPRYCLNGIADREGREIITSALLKNYQPQSTMVECIKMEDTAAGVNPAKQRGHRATVIEVRRPM
jgi:hypothetical protein